MAQYMGDALGACNKAEGLRAISASDPKQTFGIIAQPSLSVPRKAVKDDRLRDRVEAFDGPSTARPLALLRDSSAGPVGRQLLPFAGRTHDGPRLGRGDRPCPWKTLQRRPAEPQR